jgi:hypothetical protein
VGEEKQDRRFLRIPGEVARRVREKERVCERNLGCRCTRCGKRRERDLEEGERSEVEG